MDAEQIASVKQTLEKIVPGKTYPSSVLITEAPTEQPMKIKFNLQSYVVGMYTAIYINDATMPIQTGDHNNKKMVTGLKKDILKALDRGATVEIGTIRNVEV
jgi:hypothetical protein